MQSFDLVPEELRDPVVRFHERSGTLPIPQPYRDQLQRAVAGSEFVASALLQDPQALDWFLGRESGAATAGYEPRAAAAPTVEAALFLLREWRRREMLRIAWRAICGSAAVTETLEAVSDLADACIRAAVKAAQQHLRPVFGTPRGAAGAASQILVLGMGKLGGRELNFSSDVDLVFLFSEEGETDGPRTLDNQEYFNRLGREIIRLLDLRNADGFVFRVDMRLRPFGESGPLVVSLASLENYLQEHGRDWERYAWIKARPIVGAAAYAPAYEEFVRPFVYRRYLDFGVFESLRDMKALIVREVARRDLDQHLKLGRGGIREVEFIVQSMQLVRGGSDRRLQNASLLTVLPMLAGSKVVFAQDIAELTAAYLILRRAENALQMIRDEQTHTLPKDALDRARLALNMGLADWSAAFELIESTRDKVAAQFEALLFGAADAQRRDEDIGVVWLDSDNAKIGEELQARRLSAGRDRGGHRGIGGISRGGPLSTTGRSGAPAPVHHPGALAQVGGATCGSCDRGAAGAARTRGHRRPFIVSGASEGTAAGAGSFDRGLRHQRVPGAADRGLPAAARRTDRCQGLR